MVRPPPDNRVKTDDVTNTRGLEWDDFCLRKELLMGIVSKGFDKPSPIQEEAIPMILASKHFCCWSVCLTQKSSKKHVKLFENEILLVFLYINIFDY